MSRVTLDQKRKDLNTKFYKFIGAVEPKPTIQELMLLSHFVEFLLSDNINNVPGYIASSKQEDK